MKNDIIIEELKKMVKEIQNGTNKEITLRGIIRVITIFQKATPLRGELNQQFLSQLRDIMLEVKENTKMIGYEIKELEQQLEELKR